MDKKKLVFVLLSIVLAALLDFFGLDAIALLLLTSSLAFCFVTLGRKAYAVLSVLTVLALFCASGFHIVHTVILTAFTVPVSCFLGYGFSKNKSLASIMTSACMAAIIVAAGAVVYSMKTNNASAFRVITGVGIEDIKAAFEQANVNSLAIQEMEMIVQTIDLLLPSMVIISVCMSVYAAFGLARFILEKNGYTYPGLRRFSELRLNRGFTMVFLLIALASVFFNTNGIMLNVMFVVSTLLMLCGLSYIDFILSGKNVKKPIRFIIYIAVYILSVLTGFGALVLLLGLLILGITDSVKDLRSRKVQQL